MNNEGNREIFDNIYIYSKRINCLIKYMSSEIKKEEKLIIIDCISELAINIENLVSNIVD